MINLAPDMPDAVFIALTHVRKFHPEVTMVVYNNWGWCFLTEDFEAPALSQKLDQDILDDAFDSVTNIPSVFEY